MRKVSFAFLIASIGLVPQGSWAQPSPNPTPGWVSESRILDVSSRERVPISSESLADREGIREAIILWGIGIDEDDDVLKRSVLTEDATLIGYVGNDQPLITMSPRDNVISGMSVHFARQKDQRRHAVSNIVIQNLSKSSADVYAYSIVSATMGGRTELASAVVYSAKVVKCKDNIWRIKQLKVALDAGSKSDIEELDVVLTDNTEVEDK